MTITLTEAQRQRLDEAADFWLATTRANGSPHLVPIWAVRVGDLLYMATEPRSQKVRNLRASPRAALSLPDTRRVLILEGSATLLEGAPPDVLERFAAKYEWHLHSGDEWVLIRFSPEKILDWNSE